MTDPINDVAAGPSVRASLSDPHPHWAVENKNENYPKTVEEWDPHKDPVGEHLTRAVRRLRVAMDRDDPRAPDEMALISRWDLTTLVHDWWHKCAVFDIWRAERAAKRDTADLPQAASKRPAAFLAWAREMFGPVATVRGERLLRFIEEAIELAHADEMDRSTLDVIANRVYSRPPGEINKEIGQAQACLETYAENIGESCDLLAELEWQRVQTIPQAEWDRRHAAKQAIGIALSRPDRK